MKNSQHASLVCVGLVDRWMKKFLGADAAAQALHLASLQAAAEQQQQQQQQQADPLDENILRARGRLSVDREGRRYAEGTDFQAELHALDGAGRR